MADTITHTNKGADQHYSIAELNTLFTQIKTVIDGKLDRRASTLERDLRLVAGTIINVPPAAATGDILQVGQGDI